MLRLKENARNTNMSKQHSRTEKEEEKVTEDETRRMRCRNGGTQGERQREKG